MAWVITLGMLFVGYYMWRARGTNGLICAIGITATFILGTIVDRLTNDLFSPIYAATVDIALFTIVVVGILAWLIYWTPLF